MTYILYNPLANGGRGLDGAGAVRAALREETPVLMDITAMDPSAFLRSLPETDSVILCGGDGTIHRLVNALEGRAPAVPIQIWRFGTGNDFLRDVSDGAGERSVLLNPRMGRLPTAEFSGERRWFLNGCSVGVDAEVCAMVAENHRAGRRAGYALTALGCFFRRYTPRPGRVTVDGVTREYDRLWMAAAMNGRYQGGGMCFAPGQDREGSTLTCMVWHGSSRLGTLLRFPFVIPGAHTRFTACCDMRAGREIVVELSAPATLQADGEVTPGVSVFCARK